MKKFIKHRGIAALLDQENIDTDQIIPKEHLKSIKKTGFGPALFSGWRYLKVGSENSEFPLNQPHAKKASILLTGNNFGCGSSREHAVWAILQDGYKIVIAPSKKSGEETIPAFADIFKNNSSKNGLLTIELSEQEFLKLKTQHLEQLELMWEVNLEKQTILLNDQEYGFKIDSSVKQRLLKGLDDIGVTLEHSKAIETFEARRVDYSSQ